VVDHAADAVAIAWEFLDRQDNRYVQVVAAGAPLRLRVSYSPASWVCQARRLTGGTRREGGEIASRKKCPRSDGSDRGLGRRTGEGGSRSRDYVV